MTLSEISVTAGTGRSLLSTVLVTNAAYSALAGLVLAVGAVRLDTTFGVHAGWLVGLGAGLIAYADLLYFWATHDAWHRRGGRIALAGDVAWVVAAAIVVITGALTETGSLVLVIVSVPVALFAEGEWLGLRRLGD